MQKQQTAGRGRTGARTIRGSLIFSQCCILLILTLLLGSGIYTYTCGVLKTRNREAYGKILNAAEVIMDDTLAYYKDVARLILENDAVQRTMREQHAGQPAGAAGIFMDNAAFQALDDELGIYANGVQGVESLYLFDNEGRLFYVDAKAKSMDVAASIDYGRIQQTEWYRQALEAKGAELFVGDHVLGEDENTFSCVKVLNTLNKFEKIGLLVLNIRKDVLESVFQSGAQEGERYGIFYAQGGTRQEVYYSGPAAESGVTLAKLLKDGEADYEITTHVCGIPGWELWHIVRRDAVFREAKQIRLIIILQRDYGINF